MSVTWVFMGATWVLTWLLQVWKLVHEVNKKELESDRFDDN